MKWIILITISIFNNDSRIDAKKHQFVIPSTFAECSFAKADIDYVFKDPYNTTVIKGYCYTEQEWQNKNL